MIGRGSKNNFLIFLSLFIAVCCVSCTAGYCRKPYRDLDGMKLGEVTAKREPVISGERVRVYKYDGRLQCDLGQEIPLKKMAKELKGIEIFRQEKRYDGLVHVTVCGSTTGYANVYTIQTKDYEEAKRRGFELWRFN